MTEIAKIPTLQELVKDTETSIAQNALMVILNQEPPAAWLSHHPTAKIKNAQGQDVPLPYMPIARIEYLLTRIYTKWWVEVKSVNCIANSTVVVVRLYVINPLTKETEWNDGIGASPIQTNAGAGAMDWNAAKSHGVQISAPAAETYAIKDAAEKFGKLFGKDIARRDAINYADLLKTAPPDIEDLKTLFELKKAQLTEKEVADITRILNNKETFSYNKINSLLKSK